MTQAETKEAIAANAANKAVATTQSTAVEAFDMTSMYEQAGKGTNNLTIDDCAVPFLKLAQAMSHELDKTDSRYIKGLEAGDFFNSVTKEIYKGDEGFMVIPVYYERKELEWKKEGGLAGMHSLRENLRAQVKPSEDGKKDLLPNGNELQLSAQHYVLTINKDGSVSEAVIAMKRTQLKISKRWNSTMKSLLINGPKGGFCPPTFGTIYKINSVVEVNGAGQKFYNFSYERVLKHDLLDEQFGLLNDKVIFDKAALMNAAAEKGEIDSKLSFENDSDEVIRDNIM